MRSSDRPIEVKLDVPLAPYTTLGIGGAARWFSRAADSAAVASAHSWAHDRGAPLFVLGGGSNLVISDEGVNALVLQMATSGIQTSVEGTYTSLTAAAGEDWDAFVAGAVARGLAGLECLSGIPGTVGGTPIQNVGAYGQEVASTIEFVTAFDRSEGRLVRLTAPECAFGYRMSRFKSVDAERFVVCDVTFRLSEGPPTITYPDLIDQLGRQAATAPALRDVREAVLAIRRRKGMVIDAADSDTRSVGSFFMNPVVDAARYWSLAGSESAPPPHYAMRNGQLKVPAAWLIERSGFAKGRLEGCVGLSTKHPLAIVNRGGATARDVVAFAGRIKRAVIRQFGISLRPEPMFVGFAHDPDVEFLLAP